MVREGACFAASCAADNSPSNTSTSCSSSVARDDRSSTTPRRSMHGSGGEKGYQSYSTTGVV